MTIVLDKAECLVVQKLVLAEIDRVRKNIELDDSKLDKDERHCAAFLEKRCTDYLAWLTATGGDL